MAPFSNYFGAIANQRPSDLRPVCEVVTAPVFLALVTDGFPQEQQIFLACGNYRFVGRVAATGIDIG